MAQWRITSPMIFDGVRFRGQSVATVERVRPSRDGHDTGIAAVSYEPTVTLGPVYSNEETANSAHGRPLDSRPTYVD